VPSYRDFEALLSADDIQDIFAHYRKRGGNPDNLRSLLELLWESSQERGKERDRTTVPPRTLKARLEKLEKEMEKLLLAGLPSSRLFDSLSHTWRQIRRFRKSHETDQSVPKLPTRPGRPSLSLSTLVVAVLAREFQSRFGSPRYGDVLTLVKAVAPKDFPPTITTEHLYQRVRHLKADPTVKDMHALFFSSSLL
jgi:hypothetical protein